MYADCPCPLLEDNSSRGLQIYHTDSKGVELYAIIAASRYMVCSAQNDFCTI